MGIKLGSSEWKKANVSKSLGKQQQNKNARTNKSVLRALERMPIDEENRGELIVLGMDWLGTSGYMIAVKQVDFACFVYGRPYPSSPVMNHDKNALASVT
ncbi:hypothetical protein DFQ28_005031 [Apophysomyces sp. BC1034]|nr:hypothetical protein DFQ30_000603 [Apophysomyces sp. BC1015]KAG0183055.1 hypothetical protein DFQ29_000476 [Apophysomyces sp. BC1021]KAG0194818.1 hypothetical protein DFQ28_005031 [Apophysomyces sp. BC1034]